MTTVSMNTPRCKFCGEPLMERIITVFGHDIAVGYFPCDCEGARREAETENAKEAAEAKAATEERVLRAIMRAGIPKRYHKADTDRIDLIEASHSSGLYLWGPVGSGKTHIASAIGIEAIKSGRRVKFVKAGTVSAMLGYNNLVDTMEIFRNPDLLIIDDLGMDNFSDWSTSRMRLAIDTRYDTGKPTIITSNYSRSQLAKLVAKSDDTTARAIASRICEMTIPALIEGKDRRLDA